MKLSFDEKITKYFSTFNISLKDKPPRHLIHLYADYVEVVSLFSNNNFVSKSDILDRLEDEGLLKIEKRDIEFNSDMFQDTQSGILTRDNQGEYEYIEQAEENDKNQILVDNIFREIISRTYLYGSDYPYNVISNDIILKNNEQLSDRNKIYLFLLLSSNLNLFKIFESELTSEFETVSYEALKNFMPSHAEVKSMGQNTGYVGNTIEKIKQLAQELSIDIDEHSICQISSRANKDKGLDLIAWIKFNDSVPNLLTVLGQCACGKEWYKKLAETRRYKNYYKFYRNKPIHAMFIPYSQINYQDSSFYQSDEITETLLFDRKRIISCMNNILFFDSLQSKAIIDKCIEFEEDIV